MIKAILTLFSSVSSISKQPMIKIALIITLFGMVSGFVVWGHGQIKSGGYNKCLADIEKESKKDELKLFNSLKLKIKSLELKQIESNNNIKLANKTIEKLNNKREDIEYEIYNMPVDTRCDSVSDESIELFNRSIGNAPSI